MKKYARTCLLAGTAVLLAAALALGGCSQQRCVVSIEKTGTDGMQDIYTITYSDNSTDTFTVKNGTDGADGADADIHAIYEAYLEETGSDIEFGEFLSQYLTLTTDTSSAIGKSLLSVGKIYAEFVETEQGIGFDPSTGRPQISEVSDIAVSTGAAVIYRMDEGEDGYTYFVTDYHVVYNNDADAEKNGGSKLARSVYAYLYGSEGAPAALDEDNDGYADKDEDGYTEYSYGEQAIALEYVGGTINYDIAVLRARTADVKAVNSGARAVTFADGYYVGETAIAIGNPEGDGLSVTQGIISTESEYITLQIDDTARSYRSLRIDTALYSGNSGGGLFNREGELIGITNAGNKTDQNINYAVPLDVVRGTADSIIFYANDGNDRTDGAYRLTFGVTVTTRNSKYVYDAASGYGSIEEEIVVASVAEDSISARLGLKEGDVILAVAVNGEEQAVSRSFAIEDISFTVRAGDTVAVVCSRDGERITSQSYTVTQSDLTSVA